MIAGTSSANETMAFQAALSPYCLTTHPLIQSKKMTFATLLAIAVLASAQGRAYSPQTRAAEGVPDAVDAKLHSDVIKLVELSGIRAAMQNNLKQIVDRGKARMLQLCTGCDPAYSDEWAKRMLTRLNIDDFIDVYVRVYEKYFS